MRHILLTIALLTLPLSSSAKIKNVVIDPAGGGNQLGSQSRIFIEKEISLRLAKKVQSLLKKMRIHTSLTRFDDYPLTPHERIAIVNGQERAIWISLHFAEALGPTKISIYTLGSLDSDRRESNFLIPIEKAHTPWISRSKLLAQTLRETFPPNLSPNHIHLPYPNESLLGVNHPGVMIEFELNTQNMRAEDLESLINDFAERIPIAIKSFIKKEKKL